MRKWLSLFLIILLAFPLWGWGRKMPRLTLLVWGGYWELKPLREWIRDFEKESGVKVYMIEVSGGRIYERKLVTMLGAGTPPDVALVNLPTFHSLLKRGVLGDLSSYIQKENFDLSVFYPQILKVFQRGEKIYALPYVWNVFVLFYNKSMFDKVGIPYPDKTWDWKKLEEVAKKFTRDLNGDGKPDQFGVYYDPSWQIFLWQNGGKVLDEEKNIFLLNKPPYREKNLEALKFTFRISKNYSPRGAVSALQDVSSADLFATGKLAMIVNGTWGAARYKYLMKNQGWGMSVLPHGKERATELRVTGWVTFKNSSHPQKSWELIKYLSSEKVNKEVISIGRGLPPRREIAEKELFQDPLFKNFPLKDILEEIKFSHVGILDSHLLFLYQQEMEKVDNGLESIEEAMRNLEREASKILGSK